MTDYQGILYSSDGGENWRVFGKPADIDQPRIRAAVFLNVDNPVILISVADNRGAWRYGEGQASAAQATPAQQAVTAKGPVPTGSWQAVVDLPKNISVIIADSSNPNLLYATQGGTNQGASWYLSTDQGKTWQEKPNIVTGKSIVTMMAGKQGGQLYAVVGSSGDFYSSNDQGANWTKLGSMGSSGPFGQQLYVNPGDSQILFSISNPIGFMQSTDGGHAWTPVSKGLPSNDRGEAYVLSMAFDPLNPSTVYVGTGGFVGNGHGVYKSSDGGATWLPMNKGMLDARVPSIGVDPSNSAIVYAAGDDTFLYKSVDAGSAWQDISTNYPPPSRGYQPVKLLAIDPAHPTNLFALIGSWGLLFSNDGGMNWRILGVPGDSDQPGFTGGVVSFADQPAVITCVNEKEVWRWGR